MNTLIRKVLPNFTGKMNHPILRITHISILLIAILFISGCGVNTEKDLVGAWQDCYGASSFETFNFYADSTYMIRYDNYTVDGSYRVLSEEKVSGNWVTGDMEFNRHGVRGSDVIVYYELGKSGDFTFSMQEAYGSVRFIEGSIVHLCKVDSR